MIASALLFLTLGACVEIIENPSVKIGDSVTHFDREEIFHEPKMIKSSTVVLGPRGASVFITVISVVGFFFGIFWWWYLAKTVKVTKDHGANGQHNRHVSEEILEKVFFIAKAISDGASTFLLSEYKYMALFMTLFGGLMFVLLGMTSHHYWSKAALSVFSFVMGGLTSILSGWIGMRIAVFTNSRTALEATSGTGVKNEAKQYRNAFQAAFRGGLTMGFCLTSMGLLMLFVNIILVHSIYSDAVTVYEIVASFGLGGSAIACFGRIGGGIYTKAADVGADLVGKIEAGIPEDDPRNPGVIADCIGDNVGDIAGMGSDLFGSFGEATCAALIVASTSNELTANFGSMMFPLVITAVGILVCMLTSFLCSTWCTVKDKTSVEPALALQLVLPTILNSVVLLVFTFLCLPREFHLKHIFAAEDKLCTWWQAYLCIMAGLWAGLIIGYVTYYYTSNSHKPVKEVADSCKTGAATNVIYGLALGYISVLVPSIIIAITIYISYNLCLLYGFALAALGILSTMSIGLTIDAYGPISDNAGGIAEMAGMGAETRSITDALDAAGNTTAAIGKGFAISSAAFVSLALYGAFLTQVSRDEYGNFIQLPIMIIDPRVLAGLLIGSMLPFWFSALTMKSVGTAAMEMVDEIRRQFSEIEGLMEGLAQPDYPRCVQIATYAALRKMIAPALLVILTPILVGIFFGKETLAGMLPGALICGVQLAISSSNTGGAWDNAKKYIEAGNIEGVGKGSAMHSAAVVGDTVGDPLKDTSGPSLNILIKLMTIISVVFAPVTRNSKVGGLIFDNLFSSFNQQV
ncbi:vacuolar-type proton translocating pyrophosphatase 1 [Perkinsela sp. CCAP 1560/4]|nr:vacuolar-type proton translocating pyrophosphatase 1 [Perkinsela sp. CCAP 1560/4]|eukprot:KNH07631.1 vacuolar-type proton translocating pyrophosphatase 1 [Perkinsela sp. CCAP 1560/4]